jgi:hypothetical protein
MTPTLERRVRLAAQAGLLWATFQVAMMLYSGNLTVQTVLVNVVPVVLFSTGAWFSLRLAAAGLAAYGIWRLWMAYPVIAQLIAGDPMPKHWWIALLAIPFAVLWIAGTPVLRKVANR